MTQKERYEIALKGGVPDKIPWAVNFDHWWGVNSQNGTLPSKYRDMSRFDISRSLGVAIWARVVTYILEWPNVKVTSHFEGETEVISYETPVGMLYEKYELAPDFTRARFRVEHMVKGPQDLQAFKFFIQDAVVTPDYAPAEKMIEEVGDDGIVLTIGPDTPYQTFMINYAGWMDGIYLLADYTSEVEEVLEIMAEKNFEAYEVMGKGPVWICHCGDNMDVMTSPPHYERYVIPYCRRAAEIHHRNGKLYSSHYDGSIGNHLPNIPQTGLDKIEAFTPAPMGDCTIHDVYNHLHGRVVVQGGVPSVGVCPSFPLNELERIVRETLEVGKKGGFILGMGDNVPPDADIARLDFITELVEKYGRV